MKTSIFVKNRPVVVIAYCILFVFCRFPALADEYHYVNLLVGERSAGMGGAYTAIADDPSGCYYNPAGLVYATGRSLSVSVNAYHNSTKLYKDVLIGTDGKKHDWEQESSMLMPNFFGIVQPLGRGKIGFSYAVPDSILRDQQQVFYKITSSFPDRYITRYSMNMNDIDKTYNFGPSYAIKLSDSLAFGATLYVHYRDRDIIRNHLVELDNNEFMWENYYESSTEWGYKPIFGVMWSPEDRVSIGLAVSKTEIVSVENRTQTTRREPTTAYDINGDGITDYGGYGLDDVTYQEIEDSNKRKFPFTTTLGIAYFASPSLLFSGDIRYYERVSDEKKETFNVALGTEYYLNEKWAIRAGLFTDRANTPKLSSARTGQNDHIDLYGVSFSVTRFTRSSSISVGGNYTFGSGEAQAIADSPCIYDVDMQNLTFFVSAGYSY